MRLKIIFFMQVKRQGQKWTTLGKFLALDIEEASRKALRCVRPGELVRAGSCIVDPGRKINGGN